jgi:DUF177 domain-containing protein
VKLRLEDISAEAKEFHFAESQADTNRALAQGPVREYQIEGPISVEVSVYRAGTDIFFEGRLRARAHTACARCAEEFDIDAEHPFRFVLAPKAVGFGEETDLRTEDMEFSLYEGEEIDLSPLIREQLLLSLPTRPLCREDCRGLCPHCGINLNRGTCGCKEERLDPRFAALRSLKVGRR